VDGVDVAPTTPHSLSFSLFSLSLSLLNSGIFGCSSGISGEYDVSATFNVAGLTLFDTDFDSRSNPFVERGDDVDQPRNTRRTHYMFQMVQ